MASTRNKNVRFKAVFFDNADDLKACAAEARLRNIEVYDVFSPFPIHGMDIAVGLEPSRLTWIGFVAGVFGLSFALCSAGLDLRLRLGPQCRRDSV